MSSETFNIPEQPGPSEPLSIVQAPEAADPEAPFGRLGNGRPRKTPPKKTSSRGGRTAAAPRASTPRAPKKSAAVDFAPVVEQAAQMLSVAFMGLGRLNRAFLADAAALNMHAAPVGRAVSDVAQINPMVERMLTTSAPAVPYIALGTAIFNLGAQMAANHGARIPGVPVHEPEQLAAEMERQMQAAAEHAEQQQAAAAA